MAKSLYAQQGGGGGDIDALIKLLTGGQTPEEKEIQALRLKALRQGQSPSQAYKTNIDLMAGDYKTSIDLDALGTRKTELEAYRKDRLTKDKNILPTTIDYIDNVIADIDKRTVTTASFNTSIDELANIENSLDAIVKSYMNPDATPEEKSSAIDKLKKVNVSRMDISTKLQSYDRNRYLQDNNLKLLDLDMKLKGAFAIDAIHSDKLMDNHEYSIWQNAIDSDNPEIIKQYYLEQSTFKHESGKDMIEEFGNAGTSAIEAYNNWKGAETSGMTSDVQRQMKDDFNVTKNYLYTLKGQMEESMGIGKVNTMWNQIFPDDVPWQVSPPPPPPLPPPPPPGDPKEEPDFETKKLEELEADKAKLSESITKQKKLRSRLKNINKNLGLGYKVDKSTIGEIKKELSDVTSTISSLKEKVEKPRLYEKTWKSMKAVKNYAKKLLISKGFATTDNIDEYIKNNKSNWDAAIRESKNILRKPSSEYDFAPYRQGAGKVPFYMKGKKAPKP